MTSAPWVVALVLRGAEPDDAETAAIDFCSRGPSVRLEPMTTGDIPPEGATAIVSLGDLPSTTPELPTLRLTDDSGGTLAGSRRVARALRSGEPGLVVHLRDGLGSVIAEGEVGGRKGMGACVAAMEGVLGPLVVMAAQQFPLPAAGADAVSTAPAGRTAMMAAKAAGMARFAREEAWKTVSQIQWRVARIPGDTPLDDILEPGRTPLPTLRWHAAAAPGFWADPCVVTDGERTVLFVEELHMSDGRGFIRALDVHGDELRPGAVVLATDHHLSFPQVYRTTAGWLATVETCKAHNPIYTFDRLGDEWRPSDLPPLPAHIADPVLRVSEGEVTGLIGTDATVNPDAVVVEYALEGRHWTRLDDRVRVSARNGRGGGTLDQVRGLRATQDCRGFYGRALEVLTDSQPPALVRRLQGHTVNSARGVHTLTWSPDGDEVWCDAWRRRPTLRGRQLFNAEIQHLSTCSG